MTTLIASRRFVLADDGIIDPIAVEIAARGMRPVALTRTERQLAAARILARGGNPNLVCQRLHVSWTIALALAARCQDVSFSRIREISCRESGGTRPTGLPVRPASTGNTIGGPH